MNSRQLVNQAQKLRADAETHRREAERFTYNASTYRSNGDETKASVEETRAQKLIDEADTYETEATQLDQAAMGIEARIHELANEKKQLEDELKGRIAEIEKEQLRLSGSGSLF
jgi:uncharacterized coiled-coil DUF342 family protein